MSKQITGGRMRYKNMRALLKVKFQNVGTFKIVVIKRVKEIEQVLSWVSGIIIQYAVY